MFRSWSADSRPSAAGHGVASTGLDAQESSWIGLLSGVSRPAVTFLQRYLLGRGPVAAAGPGLDDDLLPPLSLLGPGLLGPGGGLLPGLTVESLRELDVPAPEEQGQAGSYLSSARAALSQALLSPAGPSGGRWGLWGGEEAPHKGLLSGAETKAPGRWGGWTLGEHTGPSEHKEQPADNGGPLTTGGAVVRGGGDLLLRLTAGCSEAVLPTPDQDHGYSSLEEEVHTLLHMTPPTPPPGAAPPASTEEEQEESSSGTEEEEEELPPPRCQNKSIAFIMGCPCSDDSQSESSEEEEDDDDDDDGFDSEGSSELTEDEDDDDDEEEGDSEDSEAERLWASLSFSRDPYDLRNFTARQHTAPPPCPIPAGRSSSPDIPIMLRGSPLGASPLAPSPLASSPPSGLDSWDDSGSEAEDGGDGALLLSFCSSSDPYSLLNFQAPIRTRGPPAGPQTAPPSLSPPPPQHRKEQRLHAGPAGAGPQRCGAAKKVRFRDDVEEIFVDGEDEEDRRGPWEQLARDRCRFLRRVQEAELQLGAVLQPSHRRRVYARLTSDPQCDL